MIETMTAYDALLLADGGRIWARMPDAERQVGASLPPAGTRGFHRVTARVEVGEANDQDRIVFNSGWGTCALEFHDRVEVDTGRIA